MIDGDPILFHVSEFNFRLSHFLIILVLSISFSTAFIVRIYPVKYGYYLNEADPFFNYRATKYILDYGLDAYWNWHDNMSWYPEGRDIPSSSQSGLHVISAYLYRLFGQNFVTLLDFTIILPVILGSLSTLIIFALVRTISGNSTAGMFCSLLFAFSPSIIQRGNLGWFKSEPLGLFLGLVSLYLLLSALKDNSVKNIIVKCIVAGMILGLANASWGGIQYFSIPISIFMILLAFLKRDLRKPIYAVITFVIFALIFAAAFPRPGISFVFGLSGIALIGGTVFLINAHFLKKLSKTEKHRRNTIFLLFAFIIGAFAAAAGSTFHTSDFRYLNALSPFLSPRTSFTEFVAEHEKPTLIDYIVYHSVLLFFAGFGAWRSFNMRRDSIFFALIIGITGVYVSGGLTRLMVYASLGILILAAIGLAEVTRNVLRTRDSRSTIIIKPANADHFANEKKKGNKRAVVFACEKLASLIFGKMSAKLVYIVGIISILLIPMIFPYGLSWLNLADNPPMILATQKAYNVKTNDWLDSLHWLEGNTPENGVIAAWWDYGYWITVLGNRTTLADNATINQTRIATIANMFMENPETGIKIAKDLHADYILLFVVAQPVLINNTLYYVLGNGGDESKIPSIIGTAGLDEQKYIDKGLFTNTFWNSTLIGHLMPFVRHGYSVFENGIPGPILNKSTPGSVSIYQKVIKLEVGNSKLFDLIYSSPSFSNSNRNSPISGILIYKLK